MQPDYERSLRVADRGENGDLGIRNAQEVWWPKELKTKWCSSRRFTAVNALTSTPDHRQPKAPSMHQTRCFAHTYSCEGSCHADSGQYCERMRYAVAFHMDGANRTVHGYFKGLGIRAANNSDRLWSHIQKRHGASTRRELEGMVENRADNKGRGDIYSLKNRSLALSLDFATWLVDMYKAYLTWFTGHFRTTPETILDIGCDNGIVTCFYAWYYPKARVVGVDIAKSGIDCARELAQSIGLSNVEFIVSAIGGIGDHFEKDHFQLATSLCSLNEIIGIPELPRHWRRDDLYVEIGEPEDALLGVQSVLRSDGRLVSADRFSGDGMSGIIWWANELGSAGLNVDWDASDWMRYEEVGEVVSMPVLVAGPSIPHGSVINGATSLYMRDSGASYSRKANHLEGLAAELYLDNIHDKRLIEGMEADYSDGDGSHRYELWQLEEALAIYRYNNLGTRILDLCEPALLKQIVSEMRKLEQSHNDEGLRCERYTGPRI